MMKKLNFKRRCNNFVYNPQTGFLFFKQPSKDENSLPIIKRVVPFYDTELREALYEKFHVGATHFDYHKTYTMIYKQHIGITQDEVEKYVNNCSTCIRNRSIKEKSDFTSVVSVGPLEHLQVNLVDLLSYAEKNDRYCYILTLIDVFSCYIWAIPLKDKESSTIHTELVNIFKNFGPPTKLQSDKGSEFITNILKNTCNIFKIKLIHDRARHPQSQGKIEKFNQMLGRHLTKMLWDEITKAPHQAHEKSPYEAFFGFKMRAVYSTLTDDITPTDDITLANDITPANDITLADITIADIIPADIISADTIFASQDNENNQASYEFHTMQVKRVHEEVLRNNETYQNKLVIRGSVHRRKLMFELGDKVAIAYDHDNNQKTWKRKLEPICSDTGMFVSMCSNNRTVKVEVNGEIKNFAAKNLKKLSK
ncbi:SCAN domain-containing protein 3-like [Gigaspora margarita]|uniref:SCAN domain-containing protein 3-like n=1 Tax=Gigaspora margarita TaxID=4874 RepID=A0A8H3XAD3_GIGMA|nr:SCAN domain-containing protein 3-like [Gigaspora margarita]